MKFIGITGGVGAGKSEILKFIAKHYKCKIYLADDVAKTVRKRGTECYDKLVGLLGPDLLKDKQKMAEALFNDETLRHGVNSIVHPAVTKYLLDEYKKAQSEGETELFFVEAALLIENGYNDIVDEMWYIYADENTRIERLMNSRGYTKEKALSIISSQLSEEEFRKGSDFVIDNSGSLEDSQKAIRERLEEFTWLK